MLEYSPCVGSAGFVAPTAIADKCDADVVSMRANWGGGGGRLDSAAVRLNSPPFPVMTFASGQLSLVTCHLSLVRNTTVNPKKRIRRKKKKEREKRVDTVLTYLPALRSEH